MKETPTRILTNTILHPSDDFYKLRRDGIGNIEKLGSKNWTDYNTHDPGITILEALCYAITDLAYRAGWDVRDLLMPPVPSANPNQPFPEQAFYTARNILTINPVTPLDFRRLLIDLDLVRNAWMICKECSCDLHFYTWCEENELKFAFEKPANIVPEPVAISPLGLYEAFLELEYDPLSGDLNDRKVERRFYIYDDEGKAHEGVIELRFPEWNLVKRNEYNFLLAAENAFTGQNGESVQLTLINTPVPANKDFFLLADEQEFKRNWRSAFSISFELEFNPGGDIIPIHNISMRIFGDEVVKSNTKRSDISDILKATDPDSFIQLHRNKEIKIRLAIESAKAKLHEHRNLDEDYCLLRPIKAEDVAVCADIEVEPGADIEFVQASIWFEIEKYFNPRILFYTLDEMVALGITTEDIFSGPELENGFLTNQNLEETELKKVLRVSDIIHELMKIPGVIAVNNLMLTKYDAFGNPVRGAADPSFVNDIAVFDPQKLSAEWLLYVTPQHQPRLYRNISSFLFYKNGLPFQPRKDEAYDTYIEMAGAEEKPKIPGSKFDFSIPAGKYRNPGGYAPVQNQFPLTYGIGPHGLPSHAKAKRRAEAKQLKAYLHVFEQLLANSHMQLEHFGDLFSLDQGSIRTYFARTFTDQVMPGFPDIAAPTYSIAIDDITEREMEALRRRNQFLDHLLARFGESFNEYSLLLNNLNGEKIGLKELIKDKISFLQAFPRISHDRYKAFDYTINTHNPRNVSGLHDRISVLLGNPLLQFKWNIAETSPGVFELVSYSLGEKSNSEGDELQNIRLTGTLIVSADSARKVEIIAYESLISQMILASSYDIIEINSEFQLLLLDENNDPIGRHPDLFQTESETRQLRDELVNWAIQDRAVVVEHLLLRPKFPGDALLPGCIEGECQTCGDEDPYSFRLTVVMPGWAEPYSNSLDLRSFADRTIREQVPSHLVAKICWIGNDGYEFDECDPVIQEIASLLIESTLTPGDVRPSHEEACACSNALLKTYSDTFREWYEDKTLVFFEETSLTSNLDQLFSAIDLSTIACIPDVSAARPAIQAFFVKYFAEIVMLGWQFEKFSGAWHAWLEENEKFDWIEERLHDRVEAILQANLISGEREQLCACADTILAKYGSAFYSWMEENIQAGNAFEDFTTFTPPSVQLCTGFTFTVGTTDMLEVLLEDRYDAYRRVSFLLWRVVYLLSQLRNTYPGATLHDCDDGSDDNPVRLDQTALGNYPLKKDPNP